MVSLLSVDAPQRDPISDSLYRQVGRLQLNEELTLVRPIEHRAVGLAAGLLNCSEMFNNLALKPQLRDLTQKSHRGQPVAL